MPDKPSTELLYCLDCVEDAVTKNAKSDAEDLLKQIIFDEVMQGEKCVALEYLYESES